MSKIATGFTAHQTAEGMRVSYTYSEIDENGNLIKSNQREGCVVLDQGVLSAIGTINDWLNERLANS